MSDSSRVTPSLQSGMRVKWLGEFSRKGLITSVEADGTPWVLWDDSRRSHVFAVDRLVGIEENDE